MSDHAVPRETARPPFEAAQPEQRRLHKIETAEIFRGMIEWEIRSGKLTSSRRRRIIQYAAQLGLSPIDAGQLITTVCRDAMDNEPQDLTLRYVAPHRFPWLTRARCAILLGLLLIAEFFVLRWLE